MIKRYYCNGWKIKFIPNFKYNPKDISKVIENIQNSFFISNTFLL
jgi:hypothetical protein